MIDESKIDETKIDEALNTWQGTLDATALRALVDAMPNGTLIGQRPGDFALWSQKEADPSDWPSGRCFDPNAEVRWWPADSRDTRVLVLGQLPTGWIPPKEWKHTAHPVEQVEAHHYLCIGSWDPQTRQWWEPRFGRAFQYPGIPLPSGDANASESSRRGPKGKLRAELHHRAYLTTRVYELKNGHVEHQLSGFISYEALEEEKRT